MLIPVTLPDGSIFTLRRILLPGRTNTKLSKNGKHGGFLTYGLPMAPAKVSGFNVCPKATVGCKTGCIFTSGYADVFPLIQQGRVARTLAWFRQRAEFTEMLKRDLELAVILAKRRHKQAAVRLNVFSDIAWELALPEIFTDFSEVQFYDYTKLAKRMGKTPSNYHLTFSRSERNEADCLRLLTEGHNVSVVYKITPKQWETKRPKYWYGFPVHDGETTDLRFLDPQGVIGLYAKGRGRKDKTGFALALA